MLYSTCYLVCYIGMDMCYIAGATYHLSCARSHKKGVKWQPAIQLMCGMASLLYTTKRCDMATCYVHMCNITSLLYTTKRCNIATCYVAHG